MTRDEKKKYWQRKVREFEGSGLGSQEFCKLENLRYGNLLRWRKVFQNEENSTTLGLEKMHFEEILPLQKIALSSGGLDIQVDASIEPSALSLIIAALCEAAKQ